MWVPINSGNRSGSCSQNVGFHIAQVVGCHSKNGISYSENGISNSESCSENTPELSESSENGLFPPRAFFLKFGWSPGFCEKSQRSLSSVLERTTMKRKVSGLCPSSKFHLLQSFSICMCVRWPLQDIQQQYIVLSYAQEGITSAERSRPEASVG